MSKHTQLAWADGALRWLTITSPVWGPWAYTRWGLAHDSPAVLVLYILGMGALIAASQVTSYLVGWHDRQEEERNKQ
jgi:hypothetical protein